MLHHTRGIVLHHFRYSETSVIARIYTEKFGLQSYLIKGVRSAKAKIKLSMLGHLSLLEMVVYYRQGKGLQNIKELKPAHVFRSLHSDIRKSSQALFINELVYKSVKEEEHNQVLFRFLFDTVVELDNPANFSADYHLVFMLNLSRFLGFAPRQNYTYGSWFNLCEGIFETHRPGHPHIIEPDYTETFNKLLSSPTQNIDPTPLPASIRKILLDKMIEFYRLHLPAFSGLQSPEVLHEVLKA
ncbi:MAG TPA: DNA repair protein RecO [Bacteroidales bacterium]|nr:DNA repair protein RecO [Bacteroidales bacterium]